MNDITTGKTISVYISSFKIKIYWGFLEGRVYV